MRLGGLILLLPGMLLAAEQPAPTKVELDPHTRAEFDKRVKDYVKLHRIARSEVHGLKPTKSAEQIEQYEHRLAHRIRQLRAAAKQGDVFTPEIAAEIRRLIQATMQGPDAARIRGSLRSGSPVQFKALRVNDPYPAGVPLQSTPPSLLMNLPPLPSELEYRLVGHDLVLRDTEANLIVDYIPNAIP